MTEKAVSGSKEQRWPLRAMLCIVTLTAATMPHLVPATSVSVLDAAGTTESLPQPIETAKENFPGSAFFLAEGAFSQAPDIRAANSEHVMPLGKVAAAPAMTFDGLTSLDRYRALTCLTNAIYYEAANEPDDGQRAVAQVVLNRVRHPAWPNTVCGVVYQGTERTDLRCQFTFSCDGSMARLPVADKWARARRVALRALSGAVFAPVGMATYYHTLAVHPDWASQLDPVAVVGAHIFYRMRGTNGTSAAFYASYAGRETISGPGPRAYMQPAPSLAAMPFNIYGMRDSAPTVQADNTPAWAPASPALPNKDRDTLPESTIKPEYRNSGRPLI